MRLERGDKMDEKVIPVQDEKIVLFQLVAPDSCLFICLSAEDGENKNKLDVGFIKK